MRIITSFFAKLAIFFLAALPAISANANFNKAMQEYQAGKFENAYHYFTNASEIGDYDSMFNLGVMHYRGEWVDRDPVKGYALIRASALITRHDPYAKTADKIYKQLNPEDKASAENLAKNYSNIYKKDAIKSRIYPKGLSDEDCEPDVLPLVKQAPLYPYEMAAQGKLGRLLTEYTVSREGYVRDLTYVSGPKGFAKASMKAALNFRYAPQPTTAHGVRNAFIYSLEDNSGKPSKIRTKVLMKELDEYKVKAENGDAVAQYVYGNSLNIFRSFRKHLKGVNLEYQEANKWFLASAKSGLPHAQFDLGRNMIEGRGCETDEQGGMKWVKASAAAGYTPAQLYVAKRLFKSPLDESNQAAMTWLKNAADGGDYRAKILLAWELVTSTTESLRNADAAMKLMRAKPDDYFDRVRILETQAAIAAEGGKFKTSVKLQKKALNKAKTLDWEITAMNERLTSYQNGKAWRGR